MAFSDGFKINVNKLNAEERLLVILTIEHPFLSEPVRLVDDSKDLVFGGDNYLAMPFTIQRQSDSQSELPEVSLIVQNVGRSMVRWVDSTGGGSGALITVGIVRRSSPTLEESIEFSVNSATVTTQAISFKLVIKDTFILKAIKWRYDMSHAPSLF